MKEHIRATKYQHTERYSVFERLFATKKSIISDNIAILHIVYNKRIKESQKIYKCLNIFSAKCGIKQFKWATD